MQVFKTYFKIINKIKRTIIVYFCIFLTLIIIMSSENSKKEEANLFGSSKTNVAIFNYDKESEFSNNFVKYIQKNENIIDLNDNKEELQDALFFRRVTYIIRIPEGFGQDFINGKNKQIEKITVSGSLDNIYMDFMLDKYFNAASLYIKNIPNLKIEKLNEYLNNDMEISTDVQVHSFGKTFDNTTSSYYFLFFAYIMMATVTFCVGTVMMVFNDPEIKKRNMGSPLKSISYNLQLLLANFVFVTLEWMIICLMSIPIYGLEILNSNTILLAINAFIFSLIALSISFMLGSILKSKNALNSISNILSLGLSFIGGIFVEQSLMSEKVLNFARFTPTYWYASAVTEIKELTVWNTNTLKPIFQSMIIEFCFAVAILLITLVIINQRRAAKQL